MNGMSPISIHSISSRYSRGGSLRRRHDGTCPTSLEKKFLRDFDCCDAVFPTLHDLLEHSEDSHTTLSSESGLAERGMVGASVIPAKRSPEAILGQQGKSKPLSGSGAVSDQKSITDCAHELPVFGDCDLDSNERGSFVDFENEVANNCATKTSHDVPILPTWKMTVQDELFRNHPPTFEKIAMGGSQWDRNGWIVRRGSQSATHKFADEELWEGLMKLE